VSNQENMTQIFHSIPFKLKAASSYFLSNVFTKFHNNGIDFAIFIAVQSLLIISAYTV
jgi:hypothetical protein